MRIKNDSELVGSINECTFSIGCIHEWEYITTNKPINGDRWQLSAQKYLEELITKKEFF